MDMLLFGKNLKYYRESKGLTLLEMSHQSGIHKNTWQGYEKGKSYPKFQDLLKISEILGVSETELLHSDLSNVHLIENEKTPKNRHNVHLNVPPNVHLNTKNTDYKQVSNPVLSTLNEPKNTFNTAKIPQVVTVAPDGSDNIVYVPVKAQAGYLSGHADKGFVEQLPAFNMPGLRTGTYRMFEVAGLSMAPTLSDRDRVICQWVNSIDEIRENRIHVVVLRDGVVIKRVLNRVSERGVIYLKSDTLTHRADYPIREISPEDILEIWYVTMKVSSDLSEPSELYTRVADLELNMHAVLKQLKGKSN